MSTQSKSRPNTIPSGADPIIIDGSILEGGGQILRNSIALSTLIGKPIKIIKIRAGRNQPGLRAQHLRGIELVSQMYQAFLAGAYLNSTEVTFKPNNFYYQDQFTADTQTAGSICLLIQISLPPLLYSGHQNHITLKGGTNAAAAPQIDYFNCVFQPIVSQHFGLKFDLQVVRRGYYPRGGGIVELTTDPITKPLPPIILKERGEIVRITIRSFVAGLPKSIATRMSNEALKVINQHEVLKAINPQRKKQQRKEQQRKEQQRKEQLKENIRVELVEEERYIGKGTGILIVAETSTGCLLAGSALGEKRTSPGKQAAEMLIEEITAGGCVDRYLQDQLIIWMALATGVSEIRTSALTLHTRTAIHFAELISGAKFTIIPSDQENDSTVIIQCQGIGLQPKELISLEQG